MSKGLGRSVRNDQSEEGSRETYKTGKGAKGGPQAEDQYHQMEKGQIRLKEEKHMPALAAMVSLPSGRRFQWKDEPGSQTARGQTQSGCIWDAAHVDYTSRGL